jgi:hypothetical protein
MNKHFMKTTFQQKSEIAAAVKQFMGTRRICYATPGTENHASNFYGDTHVCRFTRSELADIIESALDNWTDADNDHSHYLVSEAVEIITDDMQFERPE